MAQVVVSHLPYDHDHGGPQLNLFNIEIIRFIEHHVNQCLFRLLFYKY